MRTQANLVTLIVVSALAGSGRLAGQPASPMAAGEWRSYAGDLRNHHYSPLSQVTAANFNTLDVAWRFKTDSLLPRSSLTSQARPSSLYGSCTPPAAIP